MAKAHTLKQTALIFLGIAIVIWSFGPIYWAVVVSLSRPLALIAPNPSFIPRPVTWQFYKELVTFSATGAEFFHSTINSLVEAGATTLLTVVMATMAGYAFARFRFWGARALFFLIVGTIALPAYAVIVPLFQMLTHWQLVGTYVGVILVEVSAALPLATWLMRSYLAGVPTAIEDAARIDGCGFLSLMRHVILPLIGPGLASTTIVVFLTTWSQFLIPLTFAPGHSAQPLTVLITEFATKHAVNYGLQAAAGLLALIPPAIVVIRFNRLLLRGLLAGAVTS